MSINVNFKVNPLNKSLEIMLDKHSDATEQELNLAKRILSISSQLNFVDFPVSNGIDLGASIVVSEDNYDNYDDDDYFSGDEGYRNEIPDAFHNTQNIEMASFKKIDEEDKDIDDIVDFVSEDPEFFNSTEVSFNHTRKQIEDMINNNEPISWKDGESYVSINLDLEEAKKVIGGLTTPSAIATLMIYELLKKTINKVEKYI